MKTAYLALLLFWPLIVFAFNYDELGIVHRALVLALGPIVTGFVLAAWQWRAGTGIREPFVWVAFCVSVALLVTWLPLWWATQCGLGTGSNLGKLVVIALLLLSGLVGIAFGVMVSSETRPDEILLAPGPAARATRGTNQHVSTRLHSVKLSLPAWIWFVLGLILAVGLVLLAEWIHQDVVDRGPVIRWNELGQRIQAYDSFYGWSIGLLIIGSAGALGLIGRRYFRFPRPFVVGMIVGTTFLGLVFVLHYCMGL